MITRVVIANVQRPTHSGTILFDFCEERERRIRTIERPTGEESVVGQLV